jgi:hypothetical protein
MTRESKKNKFTTIVKSSLGLLVCSVMVYVYMINFATFNTAKAQNFSEQISILRSKISDLEVIYMEKSKLVTFDMAEQFELVSNNNQATKILVERDNSNKLTVNISE